MNEENWVETIKMRKNRKWKDKKENWRTGKDCWIGNAGERKKNEKQHQEKKKEMTKETEEIITLV